MRLGDHVCPAKAVYAQLAGRARNNTVRIQGVQEGKVGGEACGVRSDAADDFGENVFAVAGKTTTLATPAGTHVPSLGGSRVSRYLSCIVGDGSDVRRAK